MSTPLLFEVDALLLVDAANLDTLGKSVELILDLVEVTELEVEAAATEEGKAGNAGVVPDQGRVTGEGGESLANGSGESSHKESDGLDHGTHVLGGLGKSVLEGGDGGEDLGEGDEDV